MKYLLSLPLAIIIAAMTFIIFLELDGFGIGAGKALLMAGAFFVIALKMKIAIERLFKPKQTNQTVESQLAGQIKEKGNGLANIVGKWPGDETDEQFEEMLNPSKSKPSTKPSTKPLTKHSNPAQLKLL